MIDATLTRPGAISAEGITLTHRTPVLQLCRALIAAGHPDGPMTVTCGGIPTMTVRSIAEAATRTVIENDKLGPVFAKWSPFPGRQASSPDGLEPSEGPDVPEDNQTALVLLTADSGNGIPARRHDLSNPVAERNRERTFQLLSAEWSL